ncbi:putative sorbitol dehydrogenase [Phlyctochytrium arcticum]|nr:putative sorbitol dehydrogenase [Phlyctochytrium arcticum]
MDNKENNKSVVLVKPGAPTKEALIFEDRPIPTPGPGEVQIQIKRTGLCGSDVHYVKHGRIGDFVVKGPMVLGHESSGIVTQLGDSVQGLSVGDAVAVEPGISCGACSYDLEGRYNLCLNMRFAATPPYDGTLANFVVYPSRLCHKLPASVSLEEGALIEPLAVAVHAIRRAKLQLAERVTIFGAGPIGLLCGMVAKAAGATQVTLVDLSKSRLEIALKVKAADSILHVAQGNPSVADTLNRKENMRPDVVFECSGAEASIATAMEITKSGGRIVLVGCGPPTVSVPLTALAMREVDIVGVFRYASVFPTAIELVASKRIDVKPLITHTFAFDDAVAAYDAAGDPNLAGLIKVQIIH